MQKTLKYRRIMVLDVERSKNIFIEFPRFLDTPGLIQKDFEALMPEYSSKLIENWQEFEIKIEKISENILKSEKVNILHYGTELYKYYFYFYIFYHQQLKEKISQIIQL